MPTAIVRRGVAASDDRKRDAAQLRDPRPRVGKMPRTKSVIGIALGRWCTLPQTHYLPGANLGAANRALQRSDDLSSIPCHDVLDAAAPIERRGS
jgi:hypothetical protein